MKENPIAFTAESFDTMAAAYETWAEPLSARLAQVALKNTSARAGDGVLDIGAGTGALTLQAAAPKGNPFRSFMMIVLPLLLASVLSTAQTVPVTPHAAPAPLVHELRSHPDWPKARPADVRSVRGIVEAFFGAISAPRGGTLDRERLQSLFVPGGRIEIPLPASGVESTDVEFVRPDGYADMSDAATKKEGFFDRSIAMHVERFGVMAHVWVSYESRKSLSDPKPFVRGVKSFELLNSGGRWYITQVTWVRERPGNMIPSIYLHDNSQ